MCAKDWKKRLAKTESLKLLNSMGISSEQAMRFPRALSGGQRQRISVARALATRPKVLIADEPTTALDVTVQAQVLKLMREIRDTSGASILFITHDLGVVAQLCDWVYVMHAGEVVRRSVTVTSMSICSQAGCHTRKNCALPRRVWVNAV